MTASILQQLLALYFPIIYSWQFSSSEKSLVGKKISLSLSLSIYIYIYIYQKDLTDLNFFYIDIFFIFFGKCVINKACAVLWATVLLVRRHLNTKLLTNFGNLISLLNIFQVTHDLLALTDPVIICIYLRITDRQENVRHPP